MIGEEQGLTDSTGTTIGSVICRDNVNSLKFISQSLHMA